MKYALTLAVCLMTGGLFADLTIPAVVSHRGESNERPENSMAAFRLAFERGVDGVECDVYATTDGKGAIIHDSTTGRTAGSGANLTVTSCTWDQLKDVRIGAYGSWIGTAYETETIPLLDDYLALLALNNTSKCVIELKSSANNLVKVVVAAVQAQPLATKDRVVFIAFDASMISAIRAALPEYEAWLLLRSSYSKTSTEMKAELAACNATGVDIQSEATFDAAYVADVKSAGYAFATWVTTTAADALALGEKGVEFITANNGGEIKNALSEVYDPAQPRGATRWDVGSYVTDGLVAFYDGIRNDGIGKPHNPTATKWVNLYGSAPSASPKTAANADATASWIANGCTFDANTCACFEMDETCPALGNNRTFQLVTTYDLSQQVSGSGCFPNFFGIPANDFGFYLDNRGSKTSTLNWKPTDVSGTRPTMSGWGGKYVTAIASIASSNTSQYFFEGTERPANATMLGSASKMGTSAATYTWGGSNKGDGYSRYSKGTVHAVRIYNKALTDVEVAQNRKADEIRFRGNGVNVVVVAALGDSDLPEDFYTVNGSYAFTAPTAVQVGDVLKSLTGYRLETWNASTGAWTLLEESTDKTFTFVNRTVRPKVRLTWLWTDAEAVRWDVDSYVKDGFVACYDGIRNVGVDQPHDADAATWANLYGNAPKGLPKTSGHADAAKGNWTANGCAFDGDTCAYFIMGEACRALGANYTFQFVSAYDLTQQYVSNKSYPFFFGIPGDDLGFYVRNVSGASSELTWKSYTGSDTSMRSTMPGWGGKYMTAILSGSTAQYFYEGTTRPAVKTLSGVTAMGANAAVYSWGGSSLNNGFYRFSKGTIHALRIYDCALTDAEVAHNRRVDEIRFRNSAAVVVDTSVPGVEGVEASGLYTVNGTHTFTAPASRLGVRVGNQVCNCTSTGYQLQTWNDATGAWNEPETVTELSFTYDASTMGKVRLTWQWTATPALTRWDVSSYVTDGLVAHFDGIRNAGADQPHDPRATTWKNLVTTAADASFVRNQTPAGCWTENGFHFDTHVVAKMDSACNLGGGNCTVQLATTFNYAEQLAGNNRWPNVFTWMENDYGIFFNNSNAQGTRTSTLTWKSGNGAVSTRPTLANWAGNYLTAIFDGTSQYLFEGTERPTAVTRGGSAWMNGSARWEFGGSTSTNNNGDRHGRGTIHAVRLYNRALTQAEVEQNRRVDEIRFRGNGVNVIVESSVLGVEANEPTGFYTVDGAYTFTAPETVTADGRDWAPAGYKLETWNAASGTWNLAQQTATGASYTYTYSAENPKVRLTWNWKLARGVLRYDARWYVPNGLVAHFDGIRNAGLGQAHDAAATTWVNVSPLGGSDATLQTVANGNAGEWLDRGYAFKSDSAFIQNDVTRLARQATMQCVMDLQWPVVTRSYPTICGTAGDMFNVYFRNDNGKDIMFKPAGIGSFNANNRPTWKVFNGRYATVFLNYASLSGGEDATIPAWKSSGLSTPAAIGENAFGIGGVRGPNSADLSTGNLFTGNIYAIRLYDRVLSEAELAWNRELDDARFHFGAGRTTRTGLVEVVSEVKAIDCNGELGCYLLRGEGTSQTFTAPAEVTLGNRTYVCAGYRLENWVAAKRQWTNPVVVANATSVTLTAATYGTNRRLTWLWTVTHGLKQASEYGPDDYVQQGLVACYDGLANDGAARAHVAKSRRWADLSYRASDMALSVLQDDASAWVANGLSLSNPDNQLYVRGTEALDLGMENTLQAVLDTPPSSQTKQYPTFFGTSTGDYGCFTRATGDVLEWKLDYWCASQNTLRPKVNGWTGRYITSVVNASQMYMTETADLGTAVARNKYNAMDGVTWTLGASGHAYDSNDLKTRCVKGVYQAARFYNRQLTAAELAQNRKVDEIRYRGAVVTNVVVASNHATATGNEANGVYEVQGSWTFTANPITVDNPSGGTKTVQPWYRLETFRNGTWTSSRRHKGGSYTYTEGSDPVRLTWCWSEYPGVIFVIH